jgi:hypothetical protein
MRVSFKNKISYMKKLRMIISTVIVLLITGSAFSFKAKRSSFCIAESGTNCTTYVQNQKIVSSGGTQFKYYPTWACDGVQCTATNNGLCTATFRLIAD